MKKMIKKMININKMGRNPFYYFGYPLWSANKEYIVGVVCYGEEWYDEELDQYHYKAGERLLFDKQDVVILKRAGILSVLGAPVKHANNYEKEFWTDYDFWLN